MNHVWFLKFLSYDVDIIQAALSLYRQTRGSTDLLQRTRAVQEFLENVLYVGSNNTGNLQTNVYILNLRN